MPTTLTAKQQYDEYQEDIARLIGLVQAKLKRHATQAKREPTNWGYAGDLGHTRSQLVEAVAFLESEEPEAIEQTLRRVV